MNNHPTLIEGKNIIKEYQVGAAVTRVLNDISIQIRQGEFVSIMGPSGSGKSTLLYILGGLDNPTVGSVYLSGEDIAKFDDDQKSVMRRRNIGFVFQFYNLIPNLNVEENILLPVLLDGKNMRDYKEQTESHPRNRWPFRQKEAYPQRIIRGTAAAGSNRQSVDQ